MMRIVASTDREKAFDMKAKGLTTKEVAKSLGITLEEAIDLIYGGQTRIREVDSKTFRDSRHTSVASGIQWNFEE